MTRISTSADMVLSFLAKAVGDVHAAHGHLLSKEPVDLRLVTSLAEGADTILATEARKNKFRLDAILPFPTETYAAKQGFSVGAKAVFDDFLTNPAPHSLLVLNNDAGDPNSERLGYLDAGRRMVAHSDILVTVWNGQPEDGIGGTAQILGEALDRGVPVIWIRPDGEISLHLDRDSLLSGGKTPQAFTNEAECSSRLATLVSDLIAPPEPTESAQPRLKRFLAEPDRSSSSWVIYKWMRQILAGGARQPKTAKVAGDGEEPSWEHFRKSAKDIGGEDFAAALQKLEARWRRADDIAVRYSHAYRSTYILNFILAGLAVLAGLLSVVWWMAADSVLIKAGWVAVEVILIWRILSLTRRGSKEKEDWHGRWLEARSCAELLRSARLLILIGYTASPPPEPSQREGEEWVEWYVRSTLREIGPPTTKLDAAALRIAITSALEDEIRGQIKYNAEARAAYHKIDHKLHVGGEILFWATLWLGVFYLGAAGLYLLNHELPHPFHIDTGHKDVFKAMVTILAAGMPAFGAALFGIRATGDFRLASEQAQRTRKQLMQLKDRLEAIKALPTHERTAQLFLLLTQALTSDLRDWAKIYRLRELSLPG